MKRAAGGAVSYSFGAVYLDDSNATVYTFTGALGSNAANRTVWAMLIGTGSAVPTGVTIDGVSATKAYAFATTPSRSLWYVTGVTATTGDVVATYAASQSRCAALVFSTFNDTKTVAAAVAYDAAASVSGPATYHVLASLNYSANAFVAFKAKAAMDLKTVSGTWSVDVDSYASTTWSADSGASVGTVTSAENNGATAFRATVSAAIS